LITLSLVFSQKASRLNDYNISYIIYGMLIDNDPKLDFDDVLIRPKRSELGSRKDVDLVREYTFKHSQDTYEGIPILAANMDHVGTIEMSGEL